MLGRHKIFSNHNFHMKVLLIVFLFSFSKSWGQAIISNTGTAVVENFTGYLGTSTLPTNWSTVGSATFNGTNQTAGTAGGWYGNNNMSFLGSGSAGTSSATWKLQNQTCNTITTFTVSFAAKLWKTGSSSPSVTISYSTNSTGIVPGAGILTPIGSFNDATASIATGTTLTYVVSSLSIPNNDFIYLRFTHAGGSSSDNLGWDDVSITVDGTPSCCTAPTTTITSTTQTICAGTATTISVNSSATIPSYTWQASSTSGGVYTNVVNNTPTGASYSGTNTSVLTVTAGSTYYYRCLVAENGTCTATSGTSTLVVNAAPSITLAPSSKTVCSGTNVSFTTSASGTSPTYQWQQNSGSGFTDIAGATTKTLTLSSVTSSMNSYSYQCVVSVASCGSLTTTPVVLTVNTTPLAPPAPSPVSNPACSNGTLSALSSTVTGVTWYWEGTNAAGTSTTNVSSSTYTYASSGTYYIRALDASGTCWSLSQGISVTVNAPVSITSGATDKGLCSGGNTTMDITGAVATKQWYVSTDNGVTFNPVTLTVVYTGGITANALSITNPPVSYNNNQYYCTVSVAGCPTLTSSIGILTVTQTPSAPPTPTVLANPACSGTALSAMSSTVAGVTWYWQGTNAAGTSTTNPTSINDNITTSGTYYVRARTDGSSCLSTSSSTLVTINLPPSVTSQPTDKTQCVGANTTFSATATGTGLTYQWQVNTGSGFANLTNVAPYSNVTTAIMTITGITAGMNGYQYQCIVSGSSPCPSTTSNFASLIITGAGAPTIAVSSPLTNAIACNSFNLSWTNGNGSNRLVVVSTSPIAGVPVNGTSYVANNTFGSGGTIAAGEFVVYKGSGSSVFITGLTASTTYYYKIFEFNGCSVDYLTSGIIPNGNITTTNCTSTPGVTGVYINACGGGCGYEGNNELIWGLTGSYGLNVNNNGPTLDYSGTTQISTYGLNAAVINALNTAVSCTNTVFVDPNTLGYIPPNSNFLIANSCMCIPCPYDLSGLCNSGPIYVVFGTGPLWACNTSGGIFGNNTSGAVKDFDLDFSPWGVSVTPSYSFTPSSLSPVDGAAITLNPSGGAATGYFNNGCAVPQIILPIELIDFYATQNGSKNDLIWKVASEKNVTQYIIENSEDGVNFKEMTRLNSLVREGETLTYMTQDEEPNSGITYYRLSTLENNGKINQHKIIDIDRGNKDWKSLLYQNDNNLIVEFKNLIPKEGQVILFELSGKQLVEKNIEQLQTKINTTNLSAGIYFVKIATPYKTENFKIIIQK